MFYTIYKNSLVGDILLYGDNGYLEGLEFYKDQNIDKNWKNNKEAFANVISQLERYFKKELKVFDIPLKIKATPFQERVYNELIKIPYGSTISYQQLAKRAGNIKASRAAGNANGKNPIAIIVPCHRVIAKDGTIGGYSGGLDTKRKLLKLEGLNF